MRRAFKEGDTAMRWTRWAGVRGVHDGAEWGRRVRCALAAVLCLALAPALPGIAVRAATTYYVGTTTNTTAVTTGCTSATNTTCTLRGALISFASGDTITFGSAFPQGGTVDVRPGASGGYGINLARSVTFDGGGKGPRLDGGGSGGVGIIKITGGTVSLRGVVLQNGTAPGGAGITLASGTLTVSASTIENNTATASSNGAGIAITSGAVTITNSTLAYNAADVNTGYGGAVYNTFGNSQPVTILNSTLAYNTATANGGGGIFNDSSTGITVKNSFVVNNTGDNVDGTLTAASTNDIITTAAFTFASALGDNGGPVPTFAIPASGSAYQTGDLATCQSLSTVGVNGTVYTGNAATDARGAARIVTINNVGKCSIGAYEPGVVQTFTALATSATSVNAAQPVTLTATVSGILGNFPTTGTVVFKAGTTAITGCAAQPLTNGVATCTTSALPAGSDSITATYTQPGAGAVYGTSPASNTVTVMVAAITCTVTSTMDPTESGKLTLRDAINAANAGGCTGDAITFGTGVTGTITLAKASGTLTLNHNVTITGPTGTNGITIDGGCTDCAPGGAGTNGSGVEVLFINNITVTLANLTIANGHARISDPSGRYGGGIFNSGTLTLTNCMVLNNRTDGVGGGLDNENAATVTGSTFTGNTSTYEGGGIENNGTLAVSNSTFINNTAGGNGSGIENDDLNATAGVATVTASTITGNHSAYSGGGVRNAPGSTLTLTESVVAGNTDTNGGPDISNSNAGTFTDGGNNVVGIGDGGAGLTNGTNGDKVGTVAAPLNVLLAPLGSYTGPTQTVAPLPGSPALDTGPCAFGITTDQRGVSRPQPAGGACDSGAFESQGFALMGAVGSNQSATVTTDFAHPLALTVTSGHNEPVTGGTVTFTINPGSGMAATGIRFENPGSTGCTVSANLLTAVCPVANSGLSAAPAIKAGVPTSGNLTYTLTSTSGAAFITPQAAPKATASATSVATPLPIAATHTPGAGVGAGTPTPLPQPVRH